MNQILIHVPFQGGHLHVQVSSHQPLTSAHLACVNIYLKIAEESLRIEEELDSEEGASNEQA